MGWGFRIKYYSCGYDIIGSWESVGTAVSDLYSVNGSTYGSHFCDIFEVLSEFLVMSGILINELNSLKAVGLLKVKLIFYTFRGFWLCVNFYFHNGSDGSKLIFF